MRYCKFCDDSFKENNMIHWCKNGSLKHACRKQRAHYRSKNRQLIRDNQNKTYRTKKLILPTKVERLEKIKLYAISKEGLCVSNKYINCKELLTWFCNKHVFFWKACWNNINSSNSWCPKCGLENREATCIAKFGFKNPTQNAEIRLKAAKAANLIINVPNWETGELIPCQGSYEVKVCHYLNFNKIKYKAQIPFNMPDGRTYTVDFFLIEENLYIEVKGFMYEDAREKWKWFSSIYKSELWDKEKLKKLNIL